MRFTITVLALGVSAVAASTINRRELDIRAEPELQGRDAPDMALEARQEKKPVASAPPTAPAKPATSAKPVNGAKKAVSPEMQKIRAAKDAVSPPLTAAKKALKDARAGVPKEFKDKIAAAEAKVRDTTRTMTEDQKKKMRELNQQERALRKGARPGAPAPKAPIPAPSGPAQKAPTPAPSGPAQKAPTPVQRAPTPAATPLRPA